MGFGGGKFMGGPMSLGQFGYMAEQEGQANLVDTTFEEALIDIRKNLAWSKGKDYDMTNEVNEILEEYGIRPATLTKSQVRRIKNAVR